MAVERCFNFSAGPATLPLPVLEQAQSELLALPSCGASILEISHRSEAFAAIMADAEARLRNLLAVPEEYAVLFLQGGSRLQFSMVPLNFASAQPSGYLLTGSWGKKALAEAKKVGATKVVWDGKETGYDRLPSEDAFAAESQLAYLHFTTNETIEGVQFASDPQAVPDGVPLVCDASSDFLCRPVEVARYGMIYACAQKNAGPAGLTIVIVRRDLLERSQNSLPGYLNYRQHAEQNSLYNTPPTFAIYVTGLVARWLEEEVGGLEAMRKRNQQQARQVYEIIDASPDFYRGHAQSESRSMMNVTFRLPSDELQAEFLAEAGRRQMSGLAGHRSVGGIRASIYNAMPQAGVDALCECMTEFRDHHG